MPLHMRPYKHVGGAVTSCHIDTNLSCKSYLSSRLSCLFLFISLFYISDAIQSRAAVTQDAFCNSRKLNSTGCLTPMINPQTRAEFKHCTTQVCFVFLQDSMFINVPPEMSSESHVRLFTCINRTREFPRLDGLTFDILEDTSFHSHKCIWAGPQCTFNNLVDFIQHVSHIYQLCIIGLMLETPQRVCNHRPSTSVLDSRMIILGKRENAPAHAGPFTQLVMPFTFGAWIVLIGAIVLFLFVAMAIACGIRKNHSPEQTSEDAVAQEKLARMSLMKWLIVVIGRDHPRSTAQIHAARSAAGVSSSSSNSSVMLRQLNVNTTDIVDATQNDARNDLHRTASLSGRPLPVCTHCRNGVDVQAVRANVVPQKETETDTEMPSLTSTSWEDTTTEGDAARKGDDVEIELELDNDAAASPVNAQTSLPDSVKRSASVVRASASATAPPPGRRRRRCLPGMATNRTPKRGLRIPYWVITGLYCASMFGFGSVFLLFYEAAIVDFLSKPTPVRISKPLQHLTKEELGKYAVYRDTALEDAFHSTIDPNHTRFKTDKQFPWTRCENSKQCMELLVSDDSKVEYIISFDVQGQYLVNKFGAFKNVTRFETAQDIFKFNGGWMFNTAVPPNVQRDINQQLLLLRQKDRINRLAAMEAGPSLETGCGARYDIGAGTVAIPLVFFVGVPLLIATAMILARPKKKRRWE